MSASALVDGLNQEQAEAVDHTDGPMLILAGAGSGKTRVLTRRIARLIERGVPPWQILAVTFTNKAAAEMKGRVGELVGDASREVLVSTFHSSCARFLRRDVEAIQFGEGPQARRLTTRFTIYDDDDQKRLIKRIATELRVDLKTWPPRKILSKIDRYKNALLGPDDYGTLENPAPRDPTDQIWRAYQAALLNANAVDFNDLINLVVKLLRDRPEVLERYRHRYRYLMVDEYQDTNRAQYELVRLLAGTRGNLVVVGDDDQSIYSFRGADIRNILDFERDFPGARVVRLEQNYRSTRTILAAASAVVRNNMGRKGKELWTEAPEGDKIGLIVGEDDGEEARLVVAEMLRLRGRGVRLGDMAVIYRTNASSRAFEQTMLRQGLPHLLVGGMKFFQRREVRDVLAYLRLVLNPADDEAFARAVNEPARGVGAKTLEAIRQRAAEAGAPLLKAARLQGQAGGRGAKGLLSFCELMDTLTEFAREAAPGELVAQVVEGSGYAAMLRAEETPEAQGRLENLQELARAVEEAAAEPLDPADGPGDDAIDRLRHFLDRASLTGQSEELPDAEDGRITLLTAHLAKGLEFPVVFVAGMFEGGFPHFMARDRQEDVEEERRLVYVAFTRARERLYLSRSRRRLVMGTGFQNVDPSRFLGEIPAPLLQGSARRESGFASAERIEARRSRLGLGEAPTRGAAWGRDGARQTAMWGARPPPSTPRSHPSIDPEVETPTAPGPVRARHEGLLRTRVPTAASDFAEGARVLHPQLGLGTIQKASGPPANLKVVVDFDETGRKTLFARLARLELVDP